MAKLLKRYTARAAQTYDESRFTSERWLKEQRAFNGLLEGVHINSVLDCPFGTGRWVDFYQKLPGPIFGVDLSEDMLNQARKKFAKYGGSMDLIRENALSYDFRVFTGCDLTVCVRFVNWLSSAKARLALLNLARARSPWVLVGVSLIPSSASWRRKLLMHIARILTNVRSWRAGEPTQFVHSEKDVLEWFSAAGWIIDRQELIFSNRSRINYFFLLRRA